MINFKTHQVISWLVIFISLSSTVLNEELKDIKAYQTIGEKGEKGQKGILEIFNFNWAKSIIQVLSSKKKCMKYEKKMINF